MFLASWNTHDFSTVASVHFVGPNQGKKHLNNQDMAPNRSRHWQLPARGRQGQVNLEMQDLNRSQS